MQKGLTNEAEFAGRRIGLFVWKMCTDEGTKVTQRKWQNLYRGPDEEVSQVVGRHRE